VHGHVSADYCDLTKFASYVRGVDYVYGTPSASQTGAHTLPAAITLTWHAAASGPTPTHYAVVMGTTDVITASTSKICLVTTALSGSFTALGSQQFGATPAVGDFVTLQVVTNPSGTRVFTSKTVTTDYTINRADGIISLTVASTIGDNAETRLVVWRFSNPRVVQQDGSKTGRSEIYKHFRFECFNASDPDADLNRANGAMIDFYRVNIADLAADILTSGDGFHGPLDITLNAEKDSEQNCFCKVTLEGDYANLIDVFSIDVQPANA